MAKKSPPPPSSAATPPKDPTKRDFIFMATGAVAAAGAVTAAVPLVSSMQPAADILALATTEVDLAKIPVGSAKTVMWRGKVVFVRHRTPEDIEKARAVAPTDLLDPQKDEDRVQKPEWLVVMGNCTHLGCVPTGQGVNDDKGPFGGWNCPCHGSLYDTSGRVRKGPAVANLPVPPYVLTSDNKLIIGQENKANAKS